MGGLGIEGGSGQGLRVWRGDTAGEEGQNEVEV